MKGLGIILEQIDRDKLNTYLNNLRNSDKTQQVINAGKLTDAEASYCKVCSDLIVSGVYYELFDEDGNDMVGGMSFEDLYFNDGTSKNLEREVEKIIDDGKKEIDEIPVGIVFEVDTEEEPYDTLPPEEKTKFLPLTGPEQTHIIYVCHILETLMVYALDTLATEPTKAIDYYKTICALFKPKKVAEEPEDEEIIVDEGVSVIYGCFDNIPGTNYYCTQRGSNCPEELDIEDFDSNNRLKIEDITYIHTGCTYTQEIILQNTYEFLAPGAITYDAGVPYKIQARGKSTFNKISTKISNLEIIGLFAPISNAPGFYNNEFYDNTLKSDLDKAMFLIVNRHCNDWALPNKLNVWEGDGESIPLGQFLIEEQDGRNCIDDLVKLEAYESAQMLYDRLYALIADEQNLEDGQTHRVKEENIDAINEYINAKLKEGNIEGNIWVNDEGQLQTESTTGLGKVLYKEPIGLEKLIK